MIIIYISPFLSRIGYGASTVSQQNLKILRYKNRVISISWAEDCDANIRLHKEKNKINRALLSLMGIGSSMSIITIFQILIIFWRLRKVNAVYWIDSSLLGIIVLIASIFNKKCFTLYHNVEINLTHMSSIKNIVRGIPVYIGERLSTKLSYKKVCLTLKDQVDIEKKYSGSVDLVMPPLIITRSSEGIAKNKSITYGFIGSAWAPNIDGLETIIKIAKLKPCINFLIAGGICSDYKENILPNVKLMGYVSNIEDFYSRVEICLSPITHGSGIKVKVLEAISYGKIVFGSTHSLIGYENFLDKKFFVADDIESYIRLIDDFDSNKLIKNLECNPLPNNLNELSCLLDDFISKQ